MIDYEKGIVNSGNWYRIQQVMKRAKAGEPVKIGFLGGSITQGSLASTPNKCYAALVAKWWSEQFSNVEYINAGIGGTTSQFGAARVQDDLLRYQPDMVFVEFSVNDDASWHFQETYEGLVRKILRTGTALMLIHNVRYDNMYSAESIHLPIGCYYHLPCVSMKTTIYPEVASGNIKNREITPDDLHPNDAGHALVASVITYFLEKIRNGEPAAEDFAMPDPFTHNQYENSIRYQNTNSNPELHGFVPDYQPQEHITQMFRHGYTAWKQGESIFFGVPGTGIAVQYRKSVRKPAPVAQVIVDGDVDNAVTLDANFRENWGDCLYIDTVLRHGERKTHHVEIRIVESHEDDVVPFYLVSVIGSDQV